MSAEFLTFLFTIVGLAHVWLQLYNRRLLSIPDGRWKDPIHKSTLTVIVLIPTLLMIVFWRNHALKNALEWEPVGSLSWVLFFCMLSIWILMIWRFGLTLANLLFPAKSHRIISESHRTIPTHKPASVLPPILKDQDTTWDIEFRDVEMQVRHLAPEFDQMNIIVISDIHYDRSENVKRWFDEVQSFVNALNADLVIFTGDFVSRRREIKESIQFHSRFEAKLGKLAVLGNHDYWTRPDAIRNMCERSGIHVLSEERFELQKNGRRLIFAGTDSPWNHESVDWNSIAERGPGDCVILVSHTPDNGPAAAHHNISLILSGHNHGGQFRLPIFGPIVIPSQYGCEYSDGIFDLHESCTMVVSRGIGCSSIGALGGLRINCKPEVIRLTLRAPFADIALPVREAKEVFKKTPSSEGIRAKPAFFIRSPK